VGGYGTERDVRASLDAGFAAHLTKPIVIETLVSAIEKVLSTGTVNTAASWSEGLDRRARWGGAVCLVDTLGCAWQIACGCCGGGDPHDRRT